jgi:hypothetical protein
LRAVGAASDGGGLPVSFNVCHWGANICRAGWLARGPATCRSARDYLEAFVAPYVTAMSDWCSMMRPGVSGGYVWAHAWRRCRSRPFGVTLNPGHLIGLDEWMSSPIRRVARAAGQRDGDADGRDPVAPVYGSTRMEDGYVIADATLRADLAARFPNVARRCEARAVHAEVIGMEVPESLLPLSDTCGIVAPFLFDPAQVVVC